MWILHQDFWTYFTYEGFHVLPIRVDPEFSKRPILGPKSRGVLPQKMPPRTAKKRAVPRRPAEDSPGEEVPGIEAAAPPAICWPFFVLFFFV